MSDIRVLTERRASLSPEQRARLAARLGGAAAGLHRSIAPRVRGDRAPLSFSQQRQWFLWRLDPQSRANHLFGGLQLSGRLDLAALRASLAALVARHPSLRTVFRAREDGAAEQLIQDEIDIDLPLLDLGAETPAARQQRLQEEKARICSLPFDLEKGPLLRAMLMRVATDDHRLVVCMHHIISDAWSTQLILDELAVLYRSQVEGRAPALSPLSLRYVDYALWQRAWLAAGEGQRQLQYWRRQLGGSQPVLMLPADRPRHALQRATAAQHAFELPAALVECLRQQARVNGGTLFMTLLAAFQGLLFRYCGQADIRVGAPIANRSRGETAPVVGFFVNMQVMRAMVTLRMSLAQLQDQVRQAAFDAQAHQDLPFESLVEALRPERSLSQNPLFQVMFNHLRRDHRSLKRWPGLTVQRLDVGEQEAQFDLRLETIEDDQGRITAHLIYAAELFEPATVARLARHYQAMLRALAEQPERAVGDVPLLDEAEQQLLRQWSVNQQRYASDQPVHRLIERQVLETPQATALVFGNEELSYAELNARANRLAHRLIALGVGPESRVGIALERSLHMVVGLLAVLKAGGAYVPLDPQYPAERLAYMVQDSGIALMLTHGAARERIPAAAQLTVLQLDTASQSTGMPPWIPGQARDDNPEVPVHGQHLAYLIYTSGSTGKPKGVMVRHGALAHFLHSMGSTPGLTREDTLVSVTSLSFDIAGLELYLPLLCGARLVLAAQDTVRDGAALAQLLQRSRATVLQATPSGWRLLRAAGWIPAPGFKGLCGGEALPPDLAQELRAQGVQLWNMYGPTETTIWSAAGLVEEGSLHLGRAIAGTQLRVLDGELNAVPPGVAGELYLGGVGLARGYLNRSGLTAERFVADPFDANGARLYRSGDLVRWTHEGKLEYLGRIDHQVKVRGFRIELGEIEAQLLAQPEVREAVVVAQSGPSGTRLVGYVTGPEADPAWLRERLAQALPDYMVPGVIVLLAALPQTANGKIDRKALPEPQAAESKDHEEPQGEIEQQLAALWAEVLGVGRVARKDNFFELGGHSLMAGRLIARIRLAFQVDLPLRRVFECPQLHALAACLHQASARSADLRLLPRTGAARLSPTQRRLWLVERMASAAMPDRRAAYNMSAALRLSGPLDPALLRRTLDILVARHEVLRTRYPEDDDGDPIALIAPALTIDMALTDLSRHPAGEQQVQPALAELAGRPFNLASGPVLRAQLLRLGPTHHVLLLCVHHIAFDGWSEAVFVKDFVAIYGALRAGTVPQLPALPIQYADYAQWQDRRLEATSAQDRTFWRRYLEGAPLLSSLPLDRQRTLLASGAGDAVSLHIPLQVADRLQQLAGLHQTSLFTVLFAAFALLLHQETGADDLVIGTDAAGCSHPQLEDLIGFFVNVVPLRSRLAGTSFAQWLARIKESSLCAFEHQDVPFDQIVEHAGVPRSRQHNPLVQTLFVMQNMPRRRLEIPGLEVEPLPAPTTSSKFDLAVFVAQEPQGLAVDWVYATSLYRRETIERVSAAWSDLLRRIAAEPNAPLHSFAISSIEKSSMTSISSPQAGKLDKLRKIASRPAATRSPVRMSFLSPGHEFPLVIEAASSDIDAVAWAREQREFIEGKLRRHASVLFRNFGLKTPQEFEAFAEAIEPELYGSYGDLPKKEGGRNTYRSTPYPERQMILYHNESAHLERWPRKQWFFCELPSPVGGATPIVDCRQMLRQLPQELVSELERKELLYVRTFTPRLDVSWQDFFKTDDRAEVQARLAQAGSEWRWLDEQTLQTRTRCPAVITHPLTGERVFFNQVQLHHVSCLEPDVREDLLAMVGLERIPRHVYFGDGTPIPDEAMAVIGRAYEACAVRFDWRQGDVVMLDNMLAAHARDPYEGPRKIVVAMGAMFERAALASPEPQEASA